MRFLSLALVFAGALTVLAAPAPESALEPVPDTNSISEDVSVSETGNVPSDESKESAKDVNCSFQKINCGECNGTSCRIGWTNYPCDQGKCTKQSGGGDGKKCWDDNYGGPGPRHVVCPGRG